MPVFSQLTCSLIELHKECCWTNRTRRGTALQGGDSAKTGNGAKAAQRAPQAQDPTNRNPNNLAPAARGRYKPGARRREGASCGARPIQCPRWEGALDARRSSVAAAWWWTPRGRGLRCGPSGP